MRMQWQGPWGLVRIRQAGQSLAEAKDVPVARKYHDGDLLLAQAVLQLQREVDVVDARHVARAGRRRVLGVESEGVYIHEAVGNVGVKLVGLHEAEPGARLVREARLVVQVERGGDDGVH